MMTLLTTLSTTEMRGNVLPPGRFEQLIDQLVVHHRPRYGPATGTGTLLLAAPAGAKSGSQRRPQRRQSEAASAAAILLVSAAGRRRIERGRLGRRGLSRPLVVGSPVVGAAAAHLERCRHPALESPPPAVDGVHRGGRLQRLAAPPSRAGWIGVIHRRRRRRRRRRRSHLGPAVSAVGLARADGRRVVFGCCHVVGGGGAAVTGSKGYG